MFVECPPCSGSYSRELGVEQGQTRCWSSRCLHSLESSAQNHRAGAPIPVLWGRNTWPYSLKLKMADHSSNLLYSHCQEWPKGHFSFIDSALFFNFGCVGSSLLRGLSLVAVSGGYSWLQCTGFSLRWLLLLRSMGSTHAGFSSCSMQAQ